MTADWSPVGVSPVVMRVPFYISGQAIKQGENKKMLGFVFNCSLHGFTCSFTQAEKNTEKKWLDVQLLSSSAGRNKGSVLRLETQGK